MPPVQCLETKLPAPVIAALVGAAMKWSARAAGVAIDPSVLRMQLGVGLSQLSAALALAAVAGLWWARTTLNPLQPAKATSLVTGGVYRVSRNPLYLSLLMLLVAYAIRLDAAPITNPVTGAAHRVRVALPGGFEYSDADYVNTRTRGTGPIELDWDIGHGHLCTLRFTAAGVVRD